MDRVREEKELFERGLARYTALRNVFTQQTNELFDVIGLDALRHERRPHAPPHRGAARSPRACATAMSDFFARHPRDFDEAAPPGRPRSTT